jgi:hypothetical protein
MSVLLLRKEREGVGIYGELLENMANKVSPYTL